MAGTINTTNYGFKKYAPEDTVSTLQTFNSNMDGIDTAIKARQDENTVTAANVKKVEQGLTTVNEAINTTNNTVAAQNVQIQTNKQNITAQAGEINSLDTRVTALEGGGENVENIILQSNFTNYCFSLKKQGNKVFGFMSVADGAVTNRNVKNDIAPTNFAGSPIKAMMLLATASGNVFGIDNNTAIVVGTDNAGFYSPNGNEYLPRIGYIAAFYNGVNTEFYGYGTSSTSYTKFSHAAVIDYVI